MSFWLPDPLTNALYSRRTSDTTRQSSPRVDLLAGLHVCREIPRPVPSSTRSGGKRGSGWWQRELQEAQREVGAARAQVRGRSLKPQTPEIVDQ